VSGVNFVSSKIPPILPKSDSSMKRGQTWEVFLNVYNFMKKEAQEAKGKVPKHYRKQLLIVQKKVEKARKVSERTFRRILGEEKKA
jgi:hypothetical protein